jgi:hypothetical protein
MPLGKPCRPFRATYGSLPRSSPGALGSPLLPLDPRPSTLDPRPSTSPFPTGLVQLPFPLYPIPADPLEPIFHLDLYIQEGEVHLHEAS